MYLFKKIARIIVFLIILLSGNYLFAQKSTNMRVKTMVRMARQAEKDGYFYSAIELYEKYLTARPDDIKAKTSLALLYTKSKLFDQAIKVNRDLLLSDKNNSELLLNYAYNLQCLGFYDSCLHIMNRIRISNLPVNLRHNYSLMHESCLFAQADSLEQHDISVIHQGNQLNSIYADLAPYFINDTLMIYASAGRSLDNEVVPVNNPSDFAVSLYFAKPVDSLNWINTGKLPITSSANLNFISNGTLSPDKKRFYFTYCRNNIHNKTICGIYVSDFDGKNWSNPLAVNSDVTDQNITSTQPTVGTTYDKNIDILYFSSDRSGGAGGLDLWYLTYNKSTNHYGIPQNLGSTINTPGDEVSPFYHNDSKTLFFSTNNRVGLGGFDIFSSTGELRSWMAPVNLGQPVNSSTDDIYYVCDEKQKHALLVSNRSESFWVYNQYCCYDIFYVNYNKPVQVKISGKLEAVIDPAIGKFLSHGIEFSDSAQIASDTSESLANTKIELYMLNDQRSDSIMLHTDSTDQSGRYSMMVPKNHIYSLSFFSDDKKVGYTGFTTKNLPDSLKAGIIVAKQKINVIPKKPLTLKNIYYAFNESELNSDCKNILDSTLVLILKELPKIEVQVLSHTDNVGDEQYNNELSQKRAENVVRYLVTKGISAKRLKAVGYGENRPIAPNINPDGSDNPAGREKNRRTEFIILKQ